MSIQVLRHVYGDQHFEMKSDRGELISFMVDGFEYMHQKGSPGWKNADTEMFPTIGPLKEANYRISTPKDEAVLDQHGLLREFEYDLVSESSKSLVYIKDYRAFTELSNSKYPENSPETVQKWPYDFRFLKKFSFSKSSLRIDFEIISEANMPFMLGYHPAFKLRSTSAVVYSKDVEVSLNEILEVGSRAYLIENTNRVVLSDEKKLQLTTEGFNHFMCWTEVNNMLCIEPITFYPYAVKQTDLHLGFESIPMGTAKQFSLQLKPLSSD
ncbi:MAG: aldose epimerase [Flavobacteriaceae bacterium]|nr:aldose epimerase [Flavobacteriaceae bacterium]